jgi:lipopolysaccharide export system permease protein
VSFRRNGRRSGHPWTIYWYVAREVFFSFLVAFLFFFFIFFVNNLLLLIQNENILAKNIPIPEVLVIVVLKIPIVVLFAFPFGTLVGCLMAVARLASDNEVLALRAAGLSTFRLFAPLLILGFVLSLLSYYTNDVLLPASSLEEKKVGRRIFLAHPQLHLEAYSVSPVREQNLTIMTGRVDDNYIYDIVIFDTTAELDRRVITARRARVLPNEKQPDVITLSLEGVFSQLIDAREHDRFEYSLADSMEYNLLLRPFSVNVSLGPMEKTAYDIWTIIQQKEAELAEQTALQELQAQSQLTSLRGEIRYLSESDSVPAATLGGTRARIEDLFANYLALKDRPQRSAELDRYTLELHRKFAFPFSCLVFAIFAFPLGLLARRSGRLFGFGIGLVVSIIYWGLLLLGHEVGFNQGWSPFLSMWMPNLVILAAGIVFNVVRLRR